MEPTKDKKASAELIWLDTAELRAGNEKKSNGLFSFLVPLGCLATTAVLATGLYNLYRGNSRNQQICMRLRVLAQGVTVALAMIAMLDIRKDTIKSK